jgi:hypothetical protein
VNQVRGDEPVDVLATCKPTKFRILEANETREGRPVMFPATLAVTMEHQALEFPFDFVSGRAAEASTFDSESLSHSLPLVFLDAGVFVRANAGNPTASP